MLPTVIDPDQTGFMPRRSTDVNLRRLFTNIHTRHINTGTRTVASLDVEKAFDTVEWPFLWETLRRMGFPLLFITWLQVIYRAPTSSVRLGGGVSAPFQLSRGTRQGCPLSPALFALAIEPVAEALRTSCHIKGLRVGLLEERVALYADDMLLFLNDAGPSLQGALSVLDTFALVTGLRVNWSKSLLFPIDQAARSTSPRTTPHAGWTRLNTWECRFLPRPLTLSPLIFPLFWLETPNPNSRHGVTFLCRYGGG